MAGPSPKSGSRWTLGRPLDLRHGRVEMSHGAGGRATTQLVETLFQAALGEMGPQEGDDGAVLPPLALGERLVMACDGHVVSPLFFPGGDIGCLAVHGTVNDVAVMGARPLYLTASFILEEGFPLADLQRIVASLARACRDASVPVVAGDTKVVERGKGDGVFIATTGLGALPAGRNIAGRQARPGDAILISGTLGDHGLAILAQREHLQFASEIVSDTAPLHGLIDALLAAAPDIHVLRDPTRGGLATVLNEIARQSGVGIDLDEAAIPVRADVAAACELLGLDPLYAANEGKVVVVVPAEEAEAALATLRAHPLGRQAARIGTVIEDPQGFVQMRTRMGGRRLVDWLTGEQLPRIC